MNEPVYRVRLDRAALGSSLVGTGAQMASLLSIAQQGADALTWYAADVVPWFDRPELGSMTPTKLGNTSDAVRFASAASAFDSAVFTAVGAHVSAPTFHDDALSSEDDEDDLDLRDAVVEIRAFDSTYLFVATSHAGIAAALQRTYG
ncbi:MAG TPA: hypothetical protein VGM88_27265 [Kofleriaceae bacterium]|jgi:hypothetical protein